jgi:branched-subunit amino acid aminotransferase/4-amino-4-deoxychorismate lyase
LRVASFRLPANEPLAQFKTCNKLPQILARAEAEAVDSEEALLLNTDGFVVEAASSNLFWVRNGAIATPPISAGILAGVTRAVVFEVCQILRLPLAEASITPQELLNSEGVFVSLSSVGIAEGVALDNQLLRQSPLTERIWTAYHRLLREETAA